MNTTYPFKKSSMNFGLKMTTSLLMLPVKAAASAAKSSQRQSYKQSSRSSSSYSKSSNKTSYAANDVSDQLTSLARLYSIGSIQVANQYKADKGFNNNQDQCISRLEKKKKRYNFLRFFMLSKKRIQEKIDVLNSDIEELKSNKRQLMISLDDCNKSDSTPVMIPSDSNVKITFRRVDSYSSIRGRSFLRNMQSFFRINIPELLSLKFKDIQLCFYPKSLIIMLPNDFVVVEYSQLKISCMPVFIKEDRLDENVNYEEVQETWYNARLDGSRDLRYSYNRKMFVIKYYCLSINTRRDVEINLLFTDKMVCNYLCLLMMNKSLDNSVIPNDIQTHSLTEIHSEEVDATDVVVDVFSLSENQRELCRLLRQIGLQQNKRIARKYPQIGNYVRRKRDLEILYVLNTVNPQTFEKEYTCYDYKTDKCYLYKRHELDLD